MIASALCPHFLARLIISLTSETPSISLILVWQCSSTRFLVLLSMRAVVKSGIFITPTTDPIVSSLSNVSFTVTPFIFKKAPIFKSVVSSARCSLCTNIFTLMVSVKSVISKLTIVRSLRISRVSNARTLPFITTSPISPQISSILILSSSKSRPKITLGLSERFKVLRCVPLSPLLSNLL